MKIELDSSVLWQVGTGLVWVAAGIAGLRTAPWFLKMAPLRTRLLMLTSVLGVGLGAALSVGRPDVLMWRLGFFASSLLLTEYLLLSAMLRIRQVHGR